VIEMNDPHGSMQRPPVRGAQLVGFAGHILRALAAAPVDGARVSDLVTRTGLERAKVDRILRALCVEGLAARRAGEPKYVLGSLAFELGLAASRQFPLAQVASESMERIASLTGDTCFLMVRSGQDAVCIDRREGNFPVKALTINIGDRRPLGAAAASVAMLMHLPEAEREAYIAANAERIRHYGMLTADVVRSMVERAVSLGFALNNNNIVPEVSAVGVAIPARFGPPFAALSVSALTSRMMHGQRFRQIVRWLETEAATVARKLDAIQRGQ
jgi:DNA-binding IclR family transcriptional regulator